MHPRELTTNQKVAGSSPAERAKEIPANRGKRKRPWFPPRAFYTTYYTTENRHIPQGGYTLDTSAPVDLASFCIPQRITEGGRKGLRTEWYIAPRVSSFLLGHFLIVNL